jgi:S1-C subfamily serine protease
MQKRFLLWVLIICLPFLAYFAAAQDPGQEIETDRILRATVFVIQASADNLDTQCVGSGTIVRFDGLILTNAHTVAPSEACSGTELIIAMAVNPDEPPVPKYRASIAQIDLGLDLALLRIDRELDGRIIESSALPTLPFVELADSSSIALDNTLLLVGYPDLGNSAASAIRATALAFVAEPRGGEKSWIKLSSSESISGFISGGGAYNQLGQLVGIPTSAPITVGTAGECLLLEDTNGDGFINNNDACVPVGSGISVMRPANFARPLIRSAAYKLQIQNLTVPPARIVLTDTAPGVDRLYFTTSVTNNLASQVLGAVPAGATSLYLFFDYHNFTTDTVYEIRVSIDDVPSQTFSVPPVRWSGGTTGLWYVGSSGQPWPNGLYEFRILINGLVAASLPIRVGGSPDERPSFSNIVFGLLDEAGNLQGESYILPTGDIVSTRFIYRNMVAGTPWIWVLYYNGVRIRQVDSVWLETDGTDGARGDVLIRPENGLSPGNYRVDLFVDDRLSVTGDFVVAGAPEGVLPNVFGPISFYRANSAFDTPSPNAGNSYPDGAHTLYASFDWQRIARGTVWTMQWLVDGSIFYEETSAWNTEENGQDFRLRLTAPTGLPDGTYTLNLLINGILLRSAQMSVGIGQLEIDRLERLGGLVLRGQIVDADTGQGIQGASFVLISEDYAIADFKWDNSQVYALAITDRQGRFEIDRSLVLDAPYSVYILAEGYLPITADGFAIAQEDLDTAGGSPIEMYIPLTKD